MNYYYIVFVQDLFCVFKVHRKWPWPFHIYLVHWYFLVEGWNFSNLFLGFCVIHLLINIVDIIIIFYFSFSFSWYHELLHNLESTSSVLLLIDFLHLPYWLVYCWWWANSLLLIFSLIYISFSFEFCLFPYRIFVK